MDNTGTQQRREPKGAVEHTAANAKFVFIKYGCLCETSKTPIEGWTNPVNQKTQQVIPDKWVKVYKSLEAWVNKLEWYERHHGDEDYLGWKMHMSAGSTNYILDLPLNSEATKKFMLSARNMDFEFPLEISAWTDRDTGKLAVWLKQDGQSVFQYYKKGDMKNCPEPVQVEAIGGKKKWDWVRTDTFLWQEMQDVIAPLIERIAKERGYKEPIATADMQYTGGAVAQDSPSPAGAVSAEVATQPSRPAGAQHGRGCMCPDCDIPF